MPIDPERVATITDAATVALVLRLRRVMLALEVSLWAAFAAALGLPGEVIPSGVLVVGLVGLGLLEFRRGLHQALRTRLGSNRLVLDPGRQWIRLTRQHVPGTWSHDLALPDVPRLLVAAVAVAAAAALAGLGYAHLVPLAVGVGLVHVVATSVLVGRAARSRVLSGLALLGCVAALRQFFRPSTEEQTRAAAGVLLLLVPIGAGWALDRPVWSRVLGAPNLRRRMMTLVKAEGFAAARASLPLLLMLLAVLFAFSRGLVLTVVTALIVGAAAWARRPVPALAALLAALAVVAALNPPRDREAVALVLVALTGMLVGAWQAWPRAWIAASIVAGGLHVIAVRPYVTAVFALATALITALPGREPGADAAGQAREPARTA